MRSITNNLDIIDEADLGDMDDSVKVEEEDEELVFQVDSILDDIMFRVLDEFSIDKDKWADKLSNFVKRAVETVRPFSYLYGDSIDITKYVKI